MPIATMIGGTPVTTALARRSTNGMSTGRTCPTGTVDGVDPISLLSVCGVTSSEANASRTSPAPADTRSPCSPAARRAMLSIAVGECAQQLVRPDREVAYAHARGVVDGARHGGRG